MTTHARTDDHTDETPVHQQFFTHDPDGKIDQIYPTDEHKQAWQEYYQHADVERAKAVYQQRVTQLQPLLTAIENLEHLKVQEANNAHLAYQAAVHVPMLTLTRKLMTLDAEHADAVERTAQAADVVTNEPVPTGTADGTVDVW